MRTMGMMAGCLAGLWLVAGCGSVGVSVRYDAEAAVPVSGGYRWHARTLEREDLAFLRQSVDSVLVRKGYVSVPADEAAEFTLECVRGKSLRRDYSADRYRTTGPAPGAVYVPGEGWRTAGPEDDPDAPVLMRVITVTITAFEPDGSKRLWEATAEKVANVDATLSQAEYEAVVARALSFFPGAESRRGLITAITPGVSIEPF